MKLKKQTIIVAVLVIGTLFLAFIHSLSTRPGNTLQPTPVAEAPKWNELQPGVSTKDEVSKKLGQPKSQEGETGYYKSDSPNRDHALTFKDDKVAIIKQINLLEQKTFADMQLQYTSRPVVLYDFMADYGYYLFVHPELGVAYIASPTAKNVLEIWYFTPTTLQEFMANFGKGYSSQQQEKEKGF